VKRWQTIGLAAVIVLGVGYIVLHRQQLGLTGTRTSGADDSRQSRNTPPRNPNVHPATIEWQKIDRASDGFQIEMPTDVKQIRIPAYTETGGTQQLKMIFSNPDAETTFSVAWLDNPPVARANHDAADRVLETARDGAVARTQTTLVNEERDDTQGFPGRTFEARNTGGGVMNARLVYAGSRLYMLIASFPSVSARRDRDVRRFFNSFTITAASGDADQKNEDGSKND
jgi:hypothetical protein